MQKVYRPWSGGIAYKSVANCDKRIFKANARSSSNLFYLKIFSTLKPSSTNTHTSMKKHIRVLICAASILLLAACNQPAGDKTEGSDRSADMKERFKVLNNAFNNGETAAIDTLLSANSEDHTVDTSMHLPKGPAGLRQMIADMRAGSPDLKSEIKHMAVDGDILMVYGTISGTNSGPMMGMPATNKKWSGNFCDVVKFGSDMKMTDHWGVYDDLKIMKDLGLIPAMPPPPAATMGKPDTVIVH
jgi:predicted ester cyclase